MTFARSLPGSTTWEGTTWHGEPAWTSVHGTVRAVVTTARERLIHLGSVDGIVNLLNAPYPHVLPSEQQPWPNQGGHRFWLGPQKSWVWPPPTDWEYAAAAAVRVDGGVLIVEQPLTDSSYPAITREYAWEGARLRCTARWRDAGRPYFGMHVIPVDLPFVGSARLSKTTEVPLGLVDVRLEGAAADNFLPHPAVTIDHEQATLSGGRKVIKVGFVPQSLTVARVKQWTLSVLPGPHEGIALDSPDLGYLSQIWVGAPEHDLAELEQLTPYLRGNAQGVCASTIYLAATPPAPNARS